MLWYHCSSTLLMREQRSQQLTWLPALWSPLLSSTTPPETAGCWCRTSLTLYAPRSVVHDANEDTTSFMLSGALNLILELLFSSWKSLLIHFSLAVVCNQKLWKDLDKCCTESEHFCMVSYHYTWYGLVNNPWHAPTTRIVVLGFVCVCLSVCMVFRGGLKSDIIY